MANRPLMKCGHVAQAHDTDTGEPVCVICFGIDPGATIADDNPPSLEGRRARCTYYGTIPRGRNHSSRTCKRGERCLCEVDSDYSLPFFEYKPDEPYDRYYCGCWGWE